MKTNKDVLTYARNLIADPVRWTQGTYARNAEGEPVGVFADAAVCWCAVGAIDRAAEVLIPDFDVNPRLPLQSVLYKRYGEIGITNFNDRHTHAEVLAAFDAAIEAA